MITEAHSGPICTVLDGEATGVGLGIGICVACSRIQISIFVSPLNPIRHIAMKLLIELFRNNGHVISDALQTKQFNPLFEKALPK